MGNKNIRIAVIAAAAIVALLFIIQFFGMAGRLGQAQKELIACKKMIQQKEDDLQNAVTKLVSNQKELEDAKKELDIAKAEIDRIREELGGIKGEADTVRKALGDKDKELASVKKRLEKKELDEIKPAPAMTAAE